LFVRLFSTSFLRFALSNIGNEMDGIACIEEQKTYIFNVDLIVKTKLSIIS